MYGLVVTYICHRRLEALSGSMYLQLWSILTFVYGITRYHMLMRGLYHYFVAA